MLSVSFTAATHHDVTAVGENVDLLYNHHFLKGYSSIQNYGGAKGVVFSSQKNTVKGGGSLE